MSVLRFTGANSREAMRRVRDSLGDDALILANRRTDSGVEILAMADQAAEAMADAAAMPPASREQRSTQGDGVAQSAVPRSARESAPVVSAEWEAMSAELLREMQDMRALLARERTARAPADADDCRERLAQRLAAAGFSRALGEELLAELPEELADADIEDARPLAWLQRQLVARLGAGSAEPDPLERGGILALVGPTGVGKTTTTAKLAARYVMRHGADRVALVSTDGFRIGAHEQLRIYAELLGIPMHGLDTEQPLDELLARLWDKRFVIVDTVGMSQRDQRIIQQVARLRGSDRPVNLTLLLSAASQPEALEEVIANFRRAARAAGTEIDDCLLTKQDEAGRLGPMLDAIVRHGLRLRFVAHGQRVPEDLSPAEPEELVRQALDVGDREAVSTTGAESSTSDWTRGLLGQGRRLATVLTQLRQRVEGFPALEGVWDIAALPPVLQGPRLDELLEAERGEAAGLLWSSRQRVRGADWSMPDVALDGRGAWQALPRLQHRQPAGSAARLDEAAGALGVGVHLLAALPDVEALTWLEGREHAWLARARPAQRVEHDDGRRSLSRLAALARPVETVNCRFQGEPVRLALSSLEVAWAPTQRQSPLPALAWFGELYDPDTGKRRGRRYWLCPARLGERVLPLLLGQIDSEMLPRLTRRAWQRLADSHPEASLEVRLLMASGLAAVAANLDQSEADWAMDLRAVLLGLLGGRRRRSATALLEALLYLCVARDAIRHVGAGGLVGLR